MSIFKIKKKYKSINYNYSNYNCYLKYSNDLVNNVYAACTCCYNNLKQNMSYDKKLEYIKRRVSAGHNSILEHGRLIFGIIINKKHYNDALIALSEMTMYNNCFKYLDIISNSDGEDFEISGSIRGYKYFLNNCKSAFVSGRIYNHPTLIESVFITSILNSIPDVFFEDIKNSNVIFTTNEITPISSLITNPPLNNTNINKNESGIKYATVASRNIQNNKWSNKGIDIGIDLIKDFPMKDYFNTFDYYNLPVTVVFKNASRTCTHQIVRHRNAITQESQRYVNYSNASFTIPSSLNKDDIYHTEAFGDITIEELSNKMISVYNDLLSQKVKKEDARAFLPSNINCSKLYMTFTLENLITFVNLRTDSHAQEEIREYANLIKEFLEELNIM